MCSTGTHFNYHLALPQNLRNRIYFESLEHILRQLYFPIRNKFFLKFSQKNSPRSSLSPGKMPHREKCTLSFLGEFKRAPTSTRIPRSPCDFAENPSIPANTFHHVPGSTQIYETREARGKKTDRSTNNTANKRVAVEKRNPKRRGSTLLIAHAAHL